MGHTKKVTEQQVKGIKDPVEQHVARVRIRTMQMNPVFRAIMGPTGFKQENSPR